MCPERRPDTGLLNQNRLLTEEIQRRVNQLAAINTVAATVSQSLDLDQTLETALDSVLSVIRVNAAGISLVDERAGELVLRAQRGWHLDFVSEPMRIPLGRGLSGQVVAEDEVVVTGDLSGDERLAVPAFTQEAVRALAMAPMHAHGRVIGVLSVMSHKEYDFSQEEIEVLRAIADQVGVAVDHARLYQDACQRDRLLTAIINSAADAIIATDEAGQVSLYNAAADYLFDINPEDAIGMPLGKVPFQPPFKEELHRAMQQMEREASATIVDVSLDSGQALTAVISRLQTGDYSDGQGWVVVVRDVSHLKAAEATRMRFVETAAHDMRSPLGVTLSGLHMLHEYLNTDDPTAAEIYQIAMDAATQMQNLLDDLLNLEQIQRGSGFETQQTDLRQLIVQALEEVAPQFKSKQQTWQADIPDKLPPLNLVSIWFQRAIVNYLSNAHKYTQAGGHITLRVRVQENDLLIEVSDNGPGIPLESQGRLFERFYRGPTTQGVTRGSGLGLAMVKSIAEAHGGRVYARSRPNEGSTFGIALPLPQNALARQ